MSRLLVHGPILECDSEMFSCSSLEKIPIGARDIHEATEVDSTLFLVLKYTMEGWPVCLDQSQHELIPYFNQKENLSVS